MIEIKEIMATIKSKAAHNVETIFGQYIDPELGEDIKVTVIATGFDAKGASSAKSSDSGRKSETALNDVLSIDHFNRIKHGPGNHTNDNYVGLVNKPRDISNNLDIPTYVRKNTIEDLDKAACK